MGGYDYTEMDQLGRRLERVRAEERRILNALHPAIAAAEAAGERQVDIVKHSRLTREGVRQIVKAAKAAHDANSDDTTPEGPA